MEETAAFIIGPIIALAILVVHYVSGAAEGKGDTFRAAYLIFIAVCLILVIIGVADVILDHVGQEETQVATP